MAPRSVVIYERLCELAGVDPGGTPVGGAHSAEFGAILQALEQIGNAKVDSYGDSRMLVESADYDTKMLYSDLHRKHIRIDQLMAAIKVLIWNEDREPGDVQVNALMETFSDLAVYAVRGIQILRRLEEKGMV
jgi:ribonuclease HI